MKKYFFRIIIILSLSILTHPAQGTFNLETGGVKTKKIILEIGEKTELVDEPELSNWFHYSPTLELKKSEHSQIENIYYCPTELVICYLTNTRRQGMHTIKLDRYRIDEEYLSSFLGDLARKVKRDPVDAKFQMENERVSVFTPSQEGISLNTEKSKQTIVAQIATNSKKMDELKISLHLDKTEPEIKSANQNDLGIETLIGEGRSNFKGSPKNRIYNIKVATERFNGILIKPGEEFSFVNILGPVDGEHGYLPELVIKKDKTEPEFGGGICQVSTTTFRAAIYSGLKITARRNHAYPVGYYNPQGMDATVYVPRPDLRFINNTPGHILIQAKIEGTELIFQFYGTNDQRKVEITGPKVIERNPDGSMKTTFTQKVYDKDEKMIIKDVFNSAYDSPSKYPHPGQETIFTQKPAGWSSSEWKNYKKAHNL